jgi:16S rRNA G966 N2-methylase RsmD
MPILMLFKYCVELLNQNQQVVTSARQPIIVNTEPTGGRLEVVPATGGTQGSLFSLNALGWADEDAPLTYRFSVISPVHGEILLSDSLDVPFLNAFMPIFGTGIEVVVTVTDALGAQASSSTFIDVLPGSQTGSMSPEQLIAQLNDAVAVDDLRTASEVISALLTAQNEANNVAIVERTAVLTALESFTATQPLTLTNLRFTIKTLQLTTVVPGLPVDLLRRVVTILDSLLMRILADPSSRLLSTFTTESAKATRDLLAAVEQLVTSSTFRTNEVSSSLGPTIVGILNKLAIIQSRIVVVGESGITSQSTRLAIIVQKLSDSELINGFFASLDGAELRFVVGPGGLPTGSSVGVVVWSNASFPINTNLDVYGTVITTTLITPDGQLIRLPDGTFVEVDFDGVPDEGRAPLACGLFDEATQKWEASFCTLDKLGAHSYTCRCSQTGSITLLFSLDSAGLSGGAVAAIVVVVIVVVAAVALVVVAYLVPAVRARVFPFWHRGHESLRPEGHKSLEMRQTDEESRNGSGTAESGSWKSGRGAKLTNTK